MAITQRWIERRKLTITLPILRIMAVTTLHSKCLLICSNFFVQCWFVIAEFIIVQLHWIISINSTVIVYNPSILGHSHIQPLILSTFIILTNISISITTYTWNYCLFDYIINQQFTSKPINLLIWHLLNENTQQSLSTLKSIPWLVDNVGRLIPNKHVLQNCYLLNVQSNSV